MFIQLPNDEHNYIFFIHQYDICNSKNSCTYQPSNQAIKVAIKIQGCEQGRRRYKKNRGPPNPNQKYKRFRHFLFQQLLSKKKIPPERMLISEKKKCMNNWYTCVNGLPVIFGVSAMHRGFHGRTLRTALPPPPHPRTVGILEAELLKSAFYLQKALA